MEALLQSRILKSFKAYIRATPVALEAGDPEKRADEAASPGSPPNGTSSTGSGLAQRSSTSSWPFSSRPVSSQRLSSRPSSGRHGLHPDGDFRNCAVPQIIQIKCEVMANWLYVHQMEHCWNQGGVGEGVVVKMARDSFTACPRGLMEERSGLLDAVQRLNVQVDFHIPPSNALLTWLVRHDCQHTIHQSVLATAGAILRTANGGP